MRGSVRFEGALFPLKVPCCERVLKSSHEGVTVPGENLSRDEARERAGLLSVDGYEVVLDLRSAVERRRTAVRRTGRAERAGRAGRGPSVR